MFAQRLKELRKLNGLSQAALSSLLGVTQQAVGKWETGRSTPDPQTLARVAAYFKVSTDYLLGCAPAPITSAVAAADGPREFPIPIIGTVRAGFGAFAFEEDYGEEYARVKATVTLLWCTASPRSRTEIWVSLFSERVRER